MKQLLVKLSDEEYSALEEYCKKSERGTGDVHKIIKFLPISAQSSFW